MGACMATEHLIKQGYHKIGYLGGGKDFHIGNIRYQGFLDTLMKYNIKCKDEFILKDDRLMHDSRELIHQYLISKKRPDAVFTMTDTIGIEVIRSAKNIGIDIPQELGIIGFSDHVVSGYISPSLSSIKQPTNEIGMEAATLLMKLIDNIDENKPEFDHTFLLKPDLIVRESTSKIV
jgi:DNA-binding LacI/PurR family transcriptional regulator